mgnify:CR=1 FL=1
MKYSVTLYFWKQNITHILPPRISRVIIQRNLVFSYKRVKHGGSEGEDLHFVIVARRAQGFNPCAEDALRVRNVLPPNRGVSEVVA